MLFISAASACDWSPAARGMNAAKADERAEAVLGRGVGGAPQFLVNCGFMRACSYGLLGGGLLGGLHGGGLVGGGLVGSGLVGSGSWSMKRMRSVARPPTASALARSAVPATSAKVAPFASGSLVMMVGAALG